MLLFFQYFNVRNDNGACNDPIKLSLLTAARQEGPRIRPGEVGQRFQPHGQAASCLDPPGPLFRCSGECLRPTPR